MTREEAIAYGEDYLKDLISACCHIEEKHKDFVRMAIKALEVDVKAMREEIKAYCDCANDKKQKVAFNACLGVIDKYIGGNYDS